MVGHGYKASGYSDAVFTFNEDITTLGVSCKIIDTIMKVGEVHSCGKSEEIRDSVYKLARENSETIGTIPSRKSLEEKVLEVLVVSHYAREGHDFDKTLQSVMKRRRFFITKAGHLGVGPAETSEGHIVCVIAGCNFPIVLCKEENHYLLVGEAYGGFTGTFPLHRLLTKE